MAASLATAAACPASNGCWPTKAVPYVYSDRLCRALPRSSKRWPGPTDLYQVLDTSDVPAGVINIVTGARDPLAQVLAEHDDVHPLWYVGAPEGRRAVEAAS